MVLIGTPCPRSQFVQLVRHEHEESVSIFVMVLQHGSLHFLERGAVDHIPNKVCNFFSISGWWRGLKHPAGSPQFLTKGVVGKDLLRCVAFCQGPAIGIMQRSLQ